MNLPFKFSSLALRSNVPTFVLVLALVSFSVSDTMLSAQPALEAPFTRITNGVIGAESAMSAVGAWGDYNNDGWLDLFVGNLGGATDWLFRNNQDGTFTKVISAPLTTSVSTTPGASWADYDNDGWLDFLVASHDGATPSRLYRNLGGGAFARMTAVTVGAIAKDFSRTQTTTWADYDNDGHLDIFAANGAIGGEKYRDFLFHNEGDGFFTRVTNSPVVMPVVSSSLGSWSDYDNDGDMDLFVTHTGSVSNSLFRNDRLGQFTEVTSLAGLSDIGESLGAAWSDYDNDGDLDLFVTNLRLTGPTIRNFFYQNKGDGTFERITTGNLAEDQDRFVSCTWLDYDNDGWLDLFLTVTGQDSPTPKNRLYRNQCDGTFAKATEGRLVTDSGLFGASAWADYDNDGFPDVFVSFGTLYTPQRSALYRNNGNENSWIKVKCVGTVSNRSAIGTKIRIKAKIAGTDRWQMRQITSNEGWLTFNSLDALIGLGNATVIDTLRVEWPSGIVQEFQNLAVKQTLTIVERTDFSIAQSSRNEFDLTLKGPRQQRYRVEASTNLISWSPVSSLTITNWDGKISLKHLPTVNESQRFFRAAAE